MTSKLLNQSFYQWHLCKITPILINYIFCDFIFVAETGDYQPNYLPDQYISDYLLVPNQVRNTFYLIVLFPFHSVEWDKIKHNEFAIYKYILQKDINKEQI